MKGYIGGDIIKLQDLIANNIIKYINNMDIEHGSNKINAYINYLYEQTNISKYKLKKILNANDSRLTFEDIEKIATALNMEPYELFKNDNE